MPMRISMAMTEENDLPKCESFAASCTLEFDDELSPPEDAEAFQQAVHSAVVVCCRSVHEELRRQHAMHRRSARLHHGATDVRVEK